MGVDTRAFLNPSVNFTMLLDYFSERGSDPKLHMGHGSDEFAFIFIRGLNGSRQLAVNMPHDGSKIYGTEVSLSCNDEAKDIIRGLCEEFGGYYLENDCDDDDYVLIGDDKFNLQMTRTPMSALREEIVVKFGADRLDEILDIARRYSEIKESE